MTKIQSQNLMDKRLQQIIDDFYKAEIKADKKADKKKRGVKNG